MNGLWQMLTFVVPAAIGAACSPTLFATTVALLSRPDDPRKKAIAFWVGATASLLIWTVLVYSFLWRYVQDVQHEARDHLALVDAILGTALLGVGMYLWLRPPARAASDSGGEAEDKNETLRGEALLGLILQGRNVSSVILFVACLQHIAAAEVDDLIKLVTVACVIAITTLPIWLPILVRITIPQGFQRRAKGGITWARANARRIGICVCVVFGMYLLLRAFLGFTT